MKIGIITIHNSTNYGASLQAFALYQYLIEQGHECEVIDLHRPVHSDYVWSKKYVPYHPRPSVPFYKQISRQIKSYFRKDPYKGQIALKDKRFNDFNSQIHLSRSFHSIDDLYANPPQYDVYITGSDQVWNPYQLFCIEPYFLTFVNNPNARKISYAASVGIEELTEKERADFNKWLNLYDYISVRETEGKALLETVIDKNVDVVLDPTFLLGVQYWRKLAIKPNISEPYILFFRLNAGSEFVEYAKEVGRQSGKKIVIMPKSVDAPEYTVIRDAGPLEYLGLFANADMVITDSFHGTVFSIQMGAKNFFSYIPDSSKRGSRIKNLLHVLECDEHLLKPDLSQTYSELESIRVDRDSLNALIERERNVSINKLEVAIQ